MRLLSNPKTKVAHDPHSRVKTIFIAICAIVGGIIGGSAAPAILESVFNYYKTPTAMQASFSESGINTKAKIGTKKSEDGKAAKTDNGKTQDVNPADSKKVIAAAKNASEEELGSAASEHQASEDHQNYPNGRSPSVIFPFAILGVLLGAYLGNKLISLILSLGDGWNNMEPGDRVTAVLGVVAGVVMSIPFIVIFQSLPVAGAYVPWLILLMTLGSMTLSIYILQSISEFFPWNRGRGPTRRTGIKVLDTNVIIDGRIYEVAQNGFLEGQLYVPQFVIEELQHIADHHDPLRRQRGKRGLEVLRHMQADFKLEVGTHDKLVTDANDPVDSRLVRLARILGADLVTNDHNLNRVAALQDVRVLNVNDLALALRTTVLPQETLNLTLIREGTSPGQGVGYLDDGTMVVVENGRAHIGEKVDIEVTQVIQTERGKMIFGEVALAEEDESAQQARKRSGAAKRF